MFTVGQDVSLRSKRSRMKSDQAKQLFRIRAACKMGRGQFDSPRRETRAKMWKKRGGVGKEGNVPFFPHPHAAPSTFLLSPYFSRGPNTTKLFRARLVLERLLRRLARCKNYLSSGESAGTQSWERIQILCHDSAMLIPTSRHNSDS